MNCPREDELLEALGRGFIGSELAAHVHGCPSCTELRVAAGALLAERAEAIKEALIPSAGTMLWRIQVRQRQEAQAAARRSLLVGQAVTILVAIALMVSLLGRDLVPVFREVMASIRLSTPLLLGLATWLLLAPIAGWVAIRQK